MRSFLLDVGGRHVEDEGVAVGGKEQAEQELDGGGLAGAVGAEQAEDLAAADFEVEGPQGHLLLPAPEVAIDLGQLPRFDEMLSAMRLPQDRHAAGPPPVVHGCNTSDQWIAFAVKVVLSRRSANFPTPFPA